MVKLQLYPFRINKNKGSENRHLLQSLVGETSLLPLLSAGSSQDPFLSSAISSVEMWKALKAIDLKKSLRPDSLKPTLLKIATDYIAEPISNIFNQSLQTNFFFKQSKAAYELLLLLRAAHHLLYTRPILDCIVQI